MSEGKNRKASDPTNRHTLERGGDQEYIAQLERERTQLAETLEELYQLLEEYGPAWYGKEQHERARLVLRLVTESAPLPSDNAISQECTALNS